ncbi:hypothetical protein LguiB_032702 [Lonicera macranthoides]
MLLHLGSAPTLVVSSAKVAQQVLKTLDHHFCSRPLSMAPRRLSYNFLDIAFSPFGPQWQERRKIYVSEFLSSSSMPSFRRARESEVDLLISSLSGLGVGPVNLDEKMSSLVHGVVCGVAFGKMDKGEKFDGKILKGFLDDTLDLLDGFSGEDFFPTFGWILDIVTRKKSRLESCFRNLDGYFEKVLDEHLDKGRKKGTKDEDLVDALLGLLDDENGDFLLTKDHIKALFLNTLGGVGAIANTIVWAITEIIKNPTVMQKLQTQIRQVVGKKPKVDAIDLRKLTYLTMVVKETLRLHPPAPLLLSHYCIRQCQIDGYDIFPHTKVLINAWGIGRDPDSWKNPNEFYPERFEDSKIDVKGYHFELLPFGAGRRSCPGVNNAISTIEFTLANVFCCFDWEVPNGMKREDISMEEEGGLVMHRKKPLYLVPIKYNC